MLAQLVLVVRYCGPSQYGHWHDGACKNGDQVPHGHVTADGGCGPGGQDYVWGHRENWAMDVGWAALDFEGMIEGWGMVDLT